MSHPALARDLRAVIAATGVERVIVYAPGGAVPIAAFYLQEHRAHVAALITYGAALRAPLGAERQATLCALARSDYQIHCVTSVSATVPGQIITSGPRGSHVNVPRFAAGFC
jgi:pimeloyl-ACP methyl ester carboxylesterase